MSLDKLQRLCDLYRTHFNKLPDVREGSQPEPWNPTSQLQYELRLIEEGISPEMRRWLDSILGVYEYIGADGCPGSIVEAIPVLQKIISHYPLTVWVCMVCSEQAASLYSFSEHVYNITAELKRDNPWRLPASYRKDPNIYKCTFGVLPAGLSRAYCKYHIVGGMFYLPGESIDPAHRAVAETLFGGFGLGRYQPPVLINAPSLALPVLRHVANPSGPEVTAALHARVIGATYYTCPLGTQRLSFKLLDTSSLAFLVSREIANKLPSDKLSFPLALIAYVQGKPNNLTAVLEKIDSYRLEDNLCEYMERVADALERLNAPKMIRGVVALVYKLRGVQSVDGISQLRT